MPSPFPSPHSLVRPALSLVCVLVCGAAGWASERAAVVRASAYNSTMSQTDRNPWEGAWGDTLTPGDRVIAVSPDLLDLGLDRGTEVRIDGLPGVWTVLDRTASRHRNRIDVYMGQNIQAARNWGIQEVIVRWDSDGPGQRLRWNPPKIESPLLD